MSTNPVSPNPLSAGRVTEIVGTVTALTTAIEQIIASSGLGGSLEVAQIEKLTTLFGNLAGVAIQAAHDVAGRSVTPASVLELMPTAAPLAEAKP